MTTPLQMPLPPFRWVGGKRREAATIVRLLEQYAGPVTGWRYFVEPFCGAAAVGIHVAHAGSCGGKIIGPRVVLSDCNPLVTDAWWWIVYRPEDVANAIMALPRFNTKEAFAEVRAELNRFLTGGLTGEPGCRWDAVERAAAFLWLQAASFQGVWRVNKTGAYNVPVGQLWKEPWQVPGRGTAWEELKALGMQVWPAADFLGTAHHASIYPRRSGQSCVFYCDPPYLPADNRATFKSYTVGAWDTEAARRLAMTAVGLAKEGWVVAVSEHDSEAARGVYVTEVEHMEGVAVTAHELIATRNAGAQSAKAPRKVKEVLIVYRKAG